jgi:hypothetical protein
LSEIEQWGKFALMKTFLPFALVLSLVLAFPFGAEAKKKKESAPQTQTPPADPSNPVAALAPYISNVDDLLVLNRGRKSGDPFFQKASGDLLILRQEFVVEQEKAADAHLKNMYGAAIQTCDTISAALEDRGKVLGDLSTSQTINPDGKLNAPAKKDNLTQGIHSDGFGKAVGSIVERDRERQAIAKGEAQNRANGTALTAMAANQWNTRSAQWKQQIAAAYGQIK